MSLSAMADEQSGSWKSRYGISELCDNPIFVQPLYFGPAPGELAGVNNDESAAFNNRYVQLTGEWHFAEKMDLCERERQQLRHILGYDASVSGDYDNGALLKVSVNPIDGCGALVVYRIYRRYGEQYPENVLAVYDGEANLLDAVMVGMGGEIGAAIATEPHGAFTQAREGSQTVRIADDAKSFVFSRGIEYHATVDGRDKFFIGAIEYHYAIDPFGKITLKEKELKEAPTGINATALSLIELRQQPLSAVSLAKALSMAAKCLAIEPLKPYYADYVARLCVSDPTAFFKYVYTNRAKAKPMVNALKASFNDEPIGPRITIDALRELIEQLPAAQRSYFTRQLLQ